MAGSLNKVLLIGRLGADPEIKQMVNGKSVARLSLATSQSWKDKNTGEKKEKTEWHRVVVFNEGLVNVVQQYLKKGAQIYVEGQLTTRKWKDEQSGQDKYSTEIVIQGYNSSLTMLGGGSSGGGISFDLDGNATFNGSITINASDLPDGTVSGSAQLADDISGSSADVSASAASAHSASKELRTQLASLDTQRQTLIARIQQVDGAAAYLRGKLGTVPEDIAEEIAEEKSDEITEDNSEA